MERLEVNYKSSRVSYLCFGKGPKPAVCFHGYGEAAASYAFLEKYAGDQYTFFAIDLPFHGQSVWNDGPDFTTNDLLAIVQSILARVQSVQNNRYTLVGFSLGGRVALSLYEKIPSMVERLVLLAPDGLKVNFWYWLSTQTLIGKKLFALTMQHPGWFLGMLQMLNRLRLVNASIFKFVSYYIADAEVRRLLYARWITLRKLKPRLPQLKMYILFHHTQVRLLYGLHDRIILPARGEKFRSGIENYCTLSVIHSGHQVLHEKHINELLPALLY